MGEATVLAIALATGAYLLIGAILSGIAATRDRGTRSTRREQIVSFFVLMVLWFPVGVLFVALEVERFIYCLLCKVVDGDEGRRKEWRKGKDG